MHSELVHRPRRLRFSAGIRALTQETTLTSADLAAPFFVRDGTGLRIPISSMPGQYQLSIDTLLTTIAEHVALGIRAVLLFGIPAHKDATGSDNYDPVGIIPRAIRAIKTQFPQLVVISDLCFCEYTDHGHCGLVNLPQNPSYDPALPDGYLLNDASLALLASAAVVHAQAGADIIAPSGMLDGMVGAIRHALDEAQLSHVAIMSYAVKYASAFYGPFREAAESPPSFGDRHQYQMQPHNRREALREAALDVDQGADVLMVKPAATYLDIISAVRAQSTLPVAAYHVSGEYAMIHAAAQNGWLDLRSSMLETLIAIKRAGADIIITYAAADVARWLRED